MPFEKDVSKKFQLKHGPNTLHLMACHGLPDEAIPMNLVSLDSSRYEPINDLLTLKISVNMNQ